MPLSDNDVIAIMEELTATRHLLAATCSVLFASFGKSRTDFDAFALAVRGNLGVSDPNAPDAAQAAARIPGVLAKLDDLMAGVRRGIPE